MLLSSRVRIRVLVHWTPKPVSLLVALKVSGIAFLKSIHYGTTEVLSITGKSDCLYFCSVPETPPLDFLNSPLLTSPASSLATTPLALTPGCFSFLQHTSFFYPTLPVCSGCLNQVPHTGCLKQQKRTFS